MRDKGHMDISDDRKAIVKREDGYSKKIDRDFPYRCDKVAPMELNTHLNTRLARTYQILPINSSADMFSISINPNHFFPRSLIEAPIR